MKQVVRTSVFIFLSVTFIFLRVLWRKGEISLSQVMLVGVPMLIFLIAFIWYENRAIRQVQAAIKRLERGEIQAVIKEYEQRRARGDKSFVTMLILAAGYTYLGKGTEAEQFAREARDIAERTGDLQGNGQKARYFRDLLAIIRSDALAMQGRFVEAGQELLDLLPSALGKRSVAMFAAYYFFMAQQNDIVRQLLNTHFPQLARGNSNISFNSKKFRFMGLYMANKVFGVDTRRGLLQLKTQLLEWEKEANRTGNCPYGIRLHSILRDVSCVMGLSQSVIRPIE